MKKTGTLLILMAAMLVAVPAYNMALAAERGQAPAAQRDERGQYGPGWHHPAIAPEKKAAFDKIMLDFRTKMEPIRNDMWAKHTELEYLSRSGNAEAKNISKLVGELKSLREKAQSLQADTASKLSKDLGITAEHAHALLGRGGPCGGPGFGCGYGDGDGYGPRGPHHQGKYGDRHMRRM